MYVCLYLQFQPGRWLRSWPVEERASESLFAVRCVPLWSAADEVPQVLKHKPDNHHSKTTRLDV